MIKMIGHADDHDDDHPHGKIDGILANNVKASEVQDGAS
jgi:hypothetical protein